MHQSDKQLSSVHANGGDGNADVSAKLLRRFAQVHGELFKHQKDVATELERAMELNDVFFTLRVSIGEFL